MAATKGRSILTAVDDIFFSSRIDSVARKVGVNLVQALNAEQLGAELDSLVPDLIIFDLNSKAFAPLDTIRRLKSDARFAHTPIVGFLSHVQVALEQAAREAGCDHVLPRSVFSAKLPEILLMADSSALPAVRE